MNEDFPKIVGMFISNCGALEFFINNSIRAFSRDPMLSVHVVKSPLRNRIILLKKLLLRQTLPNKPKINKDNINSLCNELDEMRQNRNIVAHNPIILNESGSEEILIVRYKSEGGASSDTLTKENVRKLVGQSKKLMFRFTKLIPESTKA
jgi:hypothetical protein